jgi:hypothetical protein
MVAGRTLGACISVVIRLCCVLVMAGAMQAQSAAPVRRFHSSKADVEKALHGIPSYPGGKLPALEGFADPGGHALNDYKRGYYEYEVQVKSTSSSETSVEVNAKITAWYAANTPANSGYRVLKSSGRLESDLLDALDEKLNPGAATKTSATVPASTPLPDSPSTAAGGGSFFNSPRLTTSPSGSRPVASPTTNLDPAHTKQLERLQAEAKGLEEVLHNQARPTNLAVVKRSNTPVVAQPADGSEVLFQADAEDEFEVLDAAQGWVHIQISGLSRGWIKREHVDMPGAATVSIADISGEQHDTAAVRQTKEEVAKFPGKWEPLDGKQVKIIWVQPLNKDQFGAEPKWALAKSVFRGADAGAPADPNEVAGVVVIFDSEDGGMAATTLANLQQWRAGHLSDESFSKRCWRDPIEAFQSQN